jgi:hypothetical protein
MTIYSKPAVRSAWAQNAGGADLVDPGDSYAAAGFLIGVKPPRQYFNWLANWASNGVRYLCQNGIVDYDAAETYQIDSVVMGPDGLAYQSITANNIGNTPASSPTQWGPMLTMTATAGDSSNKVATTGFVSANFFPKTTALGSITGTLVNGQVPLSVVQQWQGSLAIAFSQMVGSIGAGQVPLGVVSQWAPSLSIAFSQITGIVNAAELGGLPVGPNGAYAGNTVVRYDASGYVYAGYYSQASANSENPAVSQIMVTNGADNYLRKASLAWLLASLVPASSYVAGSPGQVKIPGTPLIIAWGSFLYGGSANPVTLGLPFVSNCFWAGAFPSIGGNTPGTQGFTSSVLTLNMNNLGGTSQTIFWIAIGR